MPQKSRERDTSSLITTGARNLTILDDNDEYAGAAQTFGQDRATEMAAIQNVLNPQPSTDDIDWDDLVEAMREKGMEWCNGRCQTFKEKDKFSPDARNTLRGCKSYCKECEARRIQGKRVALLARDQQAVHSYEYRARKKKRKRKG